MIHFILTHIFPSLHLHSFLSVICNLKARGVRNYLETTIGKRAKKNHVLSHSTLVELQHGITLSTPHGLATHVNTNFFPHFIFTVFQIKYAISN